MKETLNFSVSDASAMGGLDLPLTVEEMESLDDSLAFRLFLDDVEEIVSKQKGKAREGQLTDPDFSISLWKAELLAAKQISEDRRMALSINNAVASDQNAVARLRDTERAAERDRAMALSLSQGDVSHVPIEAESVGNNASDDTFDTVSEVMSLLMAEVDLTSENVSKECGEASSSTRNTSTSPQCVSCLERVPSSHTFTCPCGHVYCNECMRQLFLNATIDEGLYPPRCCGTVIPAGVALRLLNYQELKAFSAKGIECTTIERVYCADTACSTFIPTWRISEEAATCPTCGKITHTLCKALEHPDQDCPSDDRLQQVLHLGESEGWRRCFHCRTMVELGQGCNHMTYRCGKHFCYACGLEWKTCGCDLWYEERLYGVANRVVEQEVHPEADPIERHQALVRAIDGLLNHEVVGCHHERRSGWNYVDIPRMQCEVCSHTLPEYIFECKACRMMACNRCIRNRLR